MVDGERSLIKTRNKKKEDVWSVSLWESCRYLHLFFCECDIGKFSLIIWKLKHFDIIVSNKNLNIL
ncbi:MAG: hypothetical protein AMDU4_FER2C00228G0007 [Ferroplasma sp. Type II]|nr:MAG: hypothetical protein AMDU4_FER2C00228G0007 [Ferroplasma sp. Type II]